jgi:uncharacterized protein (TIGR02145 family)
MKKHFNLQLIAFVALLSVLVVFTTCKKKQEPPSSIPSVPTATTGSALWVNQTWATLNGVVSAGNQSASATFEYDTTTSYGHSINATPDTMSGSLSISVTSNLTGLLKNTIYHYRLKAVNASGTIYGNDVTFTTSGPEVSNTIFNPDLIYGSVDDNDGNTYSTIQIGTQTWMAENLKTTKYNDNTSIPWVTNNSIWTALSTPAYCWCNNDSVEYGALYDWYTVNTGLLCPTGWHVPSDAEWTTLTTFLGGESISGNKLKETGTIHWSIPNTGATNESGFTGLPGGYRSYAGTFTNIRSYGYWWSSSESSSTEAYYRDIYYGYRNVDRSSSNKKTGFSVRCVKD